MTAIPKRLWKPHIISHAVSVGFQRLADLPDEFLTEENISHLRGAYNAVHKCIMRSPNPVWTASLLEPGFRARIQQTSPELLEVLLDAELSPRITWCNAYANHIKTTKHWELIPDRLRVAAKSAKKV